MGTQVSPGIQIQEYTAVTSVASVGSSVGGFAGVFNWGPGYTPTLCGSESDVVNYFGKPDNNTFESFFTAANFLAYSSALYVVRTYDSSAQNAIANTGTANAVQVGNGSVFSNTTFSQNISYIAKYPGAKGNTLRISVCDSPNAYSSNLIANAAILSFSVGSNTATINAYANVQGSANAAANSILTGLTIGDYIKAGNSTIGYQYLKVSSVNFPAGAEISANGTYYANTASVTFASNYMLSSNVTMSSNVTSRYWEFYNSVAKAPGTSYYMKQLGSTVVDEIHVIVVDTNGVFSTSPNQILEVWSGMSRVTDSKNTSGTSNYYKNILNNQSGYVYSVTDRAGAPSANAANITNATTVAPYGAQFALGQDSTPESSIELGAVASGFDVLADPESVALSLLLQGKANSIGGLSNYVINIAATRMDCVAFVSPDSSIITNSQPAQYAVNFRDSSSGVTGITYDSSYAFMDGSYKYQYDKYNDVYRWVPFNGDMAGLCAYTDSVRNPWYSPAGLNRGQIKNVYKLLYNPNQANRDLLYQNDINPIVTFSGQGTVLWGDKTMLGTSSPFDRINVRRLFILLEQSISQYARSSMFELNNAFTRSQFVNTVSPYLQTIESGNGIYDFQVVCDTTNNTGAVIDANQFVGDIYIKPAKSINFIQLNFIAVGTDVSFNTVVGQVV